MDEMPASSLLKSSSVTLSPVRTSQPKSLSRLVPVRSTQKTVSSHRARVGRPRWTVFRTRLSPVPRS